VTSAGEVLGPSAADFIKVLLNQTLSLGDLLRLQAEVRSQLHIRINPKLRFAIGVLNVDVTASLLAREEVESKSLGSKNRWTHCVSLAQAI
jgi:hypothetical protein